MPVIVAKIASHVDEEEKEKSPRDFMDSTRCGCVESWSSFYEELERVLREEEFDSFVESKCSPYYAKKQGRPSIPPGVYFRMLLIGYFERIDSERGICWRCSDSLSLRQFLGLGMEEANAGPFVAVSDTESTSAGSSRICIWMGARSSSVERDDRWQDTGCGRDDAGSECGASVNRSSRTRGKATNRI